jgi:hypothetical protein
MVADSPFGVQRMARGEHIFIRGMVHGIPFQHHGIDMGDGTVIHLAPADGARIAVIDGSDRFSVRRDSMERFSAGQTPSVRRHAAGLAPELVAQNAESHLGKTGYSLLDGNCEHFAALCATGASHSHQIAMAEATVSAFASMATKAVWAISSRLGHRVLIRGAVKIHPAMLLADGMEVAALAVGCKQGFDVKRSKQVARFSGNVVAAGIGGLLAGPAGAALSLAAHASSNAIADQFCKAVRKALGTEQ